MADQTVIMSIIENTFKRFSCDDPVTVVVALPQNFEIQDIPQFLTTIDEEINSFIDKFSQTITNSKADNLMCQCLFAYDHMLSLPKINRFTTTVHIPPVALFDMFDFLRSSSADNIDNIPVIGIQKMILETLNYKGYNCLSLLRKSMFSDKNQTDIKEYCTKIPNGLYVDIP